MLILITILCVKSPELMYLLVASLYPLTKTSPISPPTPAPGNHHASLCFYELSYFRFHKWVISCSICLSLSDLSHHAQRPKTFMPQPTQSLTSISSAQGTMTSTWPPISLCHSLKTLSGSEPGQWQGSPHLFLPPQGFSSSVLDVPRLDQPLFHVSCPVFGVQAKG